MTEIKNRPLRYALQAVNYALLMAFIGYFATTPTVYPIAAGEGMITIAFAHAGQLREPCRKLSQEELNELPANMRKIDDCPRERSPVKLEAHLDGKPFYKGSFNPQGLFGDGGVDIFYSAQVAAGEHDLSLIMNDSVRIEGFNHALERRVSVSPAQILLVSFSNKQGFIVSGGQTN